ncbi:hypothetical protein Zm00014a_028020 [Zea mays]|uniref:Uncharacterized protein n=1 Tax=Zea mays TaxID=4577 RepID=A0A3L6FLZ1_MAIZE|nr:hypothetical protein Zm00014a_028020 [Zea mays]
MPSPMPGPPLPLPSMVHRCRGMSSILANTCVFFAAERFQDTMEALVAEPGVEGKESKTPTEAVAQVLSSSKFLYNIGLVPATKKSCNGGDPTRVAELEAELESEKQNSLEVRAQLDALKKKVEESEEARAKELEKINDLQKGADETNALLRRLFSLNK